MIDATEPKLIYRPLWIGLGSLYVIAIIYLSLTGSPPEVELGFDYQDKVLHALAYFLMMFWFAQIFHSKERRLLFALLFILIGLTMELIQSMNPNRYAEFNDMAANTLGVAIAIRLTRDSFRDFLLKFEARIGRG